MRFRRGAITWVLLLVLVSAEAARAEDTRKKWQFGVGFSYWSTDDNIRSNSSTAYAPVDPSQAGNLPPIVFSDPRPDANELNQPTIQDDFKFDLQASYGLTRWVAIQLDASYFQGDVGNIEFYSEDKTVPPSLTPTPPDDSVQSTQPKNPLDPLHSICAPQNGPAPPGSKPCFTMVTGTEYIVKRNAFLPVGTITEAPVSLSGVVRFRPESPFDPYVGAGVGYIFTSLDTSTSSMGTPIVMSTSNEQGSNKVLSMRGFDDVQDYTNGLVVQNIRSGARAVFVFPCRQNASTGDCVPVTDRPTTPLGGTPLGAMTASVDSAMEYHLMGGIDYYFTSRWSLYIDARYVWAQSKVQVRVDGKEQVNSGVNDYGCENGGATCRSVNFGNMDTSNAVLLNPSADNIQDLIIIQGGDIRLGGFSLGIGAKVTF